MQIQKPDTIDKQKVLEYLGFNQEKNTLTPEINQIIDESITECLRVCTPRCAVSNLLEITVGEGVIVENTVLVLTGNDIKKHLLGCGKTVVFAVTLGQEIEKVLQTEQIKNMVKYVVLDTVANVLTDQMADVTETLITENLAKQGLYATMRYSAGYGDLDIAHNKAITKVLNTEKTVGIYANTYGALSPRKSVTAVIGVAEKHVSGHLADCNTCKVKENCKYKKRGITCGFDKTK